MFWSKIFMNSLVSSDVLAIDRKLFLLWVQRFYNFFRFFNWKQNMEINFNFSLRKRWKAELKLDFMNFIQLWLLRSLWSKTLIETSRTVIKGVTNLLGNSWTTKDTSITNINYSRDTTQCSANYAKSAQKTVCRWKDRELKIIFWSYPTLDKLSMSGVLEVLSS